MSDHIVEANKKVIDLDALEKLRKEATQGEWVNDAPGCVGIHYPEGGKATICTTPSEYLEDQANAAYIAAVNPATMDALISELREARGLLKSWVASAEAEYVEGLFYDDVKETRAFLSKAQGGE